MRLHEAFHRLLIARLRGVDELQNQIDQHPFLLELHYLNLAVHNHLRHLFLELVDMLFPHIHLLLEPWSVQGARYVIVIDVNQRVFAFPL